MTAVTNNTTPASDVFQASRVLLKDFQEKLAVFRECVPLAIGIDKQLLALFPEIERKVLRMTLRHHTNSLRYLKVMEKATIRYNLDGSTADEVTEVHRAHALESLRERFRKDAERRKGQREAEASEAAAEAAARQSAEKLEQLAAKFSRR